MSRKYLKIKNFKIKAKSFNFESVNFMTDLEKAKIYVAFVKLLNNHFKFTLFKKNLYNHFTSHCGFIAHYNMNGFYGEYFKTAAKFHFNVNEYSNPMSENSGNLNVKSTLSHGEQFYAIYAEINGSRSGLGEFYNQLTSPSWNDDYEDLNNALRDAFSEYLEIWREEIKKAIKAKNKFSKEDEEKSKKPTTSLLSIQPTLDVKAVEANTEQVVSLEVGTQMSLFDFMEVA